jgi:hypothetical protein
MLSKARQIVAAEATSPNKAGWSRKAAMSATQRPPPASITATCTNNLPRSWTGARSPAGGTAVENPAINPRRSASEPSRCSPANEATCRSPTATFTLWAARVAFTFHVSSALLLGLLMAIGAS